MKTRKFLISLLLLFAMCVSLLSSAAFAEEVSSGSETGSEEEETLVEEGGETSGEEGGETSGEEGGETSGEEGDKTPSEGEEETEVEEGEEGEEETTPVSSVTNADGSAISTIYYYKNGSGMGGDKSYAVKPEPEQVVLYSAKTGASASLSFGFTPASAADPAQGGTLTLSASGNKSTIESLPAGAYSMEFRFKDAPSVSGSFYIFLSASLNTSRHVKNSGQPILVTITDKPDTVIISDNSSLSGGAALAEGSDYSFSGNTLTLSASYLDSLAKDDASVTKYVAFVVNYNGVNMAAPFQITILPPPSIDPAETSWKRGTEKTFTVKPDIISASIDGTALDAKSYTVSGTTLNVKSSAVSTLIWGDHTLTAETSSGPVSAKITIEPSLGYSSVTGNQHTKGGSKNIIFIASDPVSKVYVNGTEISAEHYSISDSKNITLKASYLNTLKADTTYTITVTVSNNAKTMDVSSNFKILSGGSGNSSASGGSAGVAPQTGDSSPFLWMALLLVSGCGFAAILPRLRKEN